MDESSGGVYLKFKPHTKTKWYRCNVDFSVFVTPGRPEGVGSCEPHPALSLLEWRGGGIGGHALGLVGQLALVTLFAQLIVR